MVGVALPGKDGAPALDEKEDLAAAHGRVIKLKLHGYTWPEVSSFTGYSTHRARHIYYEAVERMANEQSIDFHRGVMFARLEEVRDALYPAVTGEGLQPDTYVPDKDVVDNYLKILREEAKALGTDAPKLTQLDTSMDVTVNSDAMARSERHRVLVDLLHQAGLDGQPMLDALPVDEDEQMKEHRLWEERCRAWEAAAGWPVESNGHGHLADA
jgi:hypothetical protein